MGNSEGNYLKYLVTDADNENVNENVRLTR